MSVKYELIIYGRKSDQAFIVEVPELPGCMAAVRPRVGERRKGTRTKRDGQTYVEAVTNAEVVISEWIETAQELWRNISTPKGRLLYA